MRRNRAETQNSALEPLGILVGEWRTVGSHPHVPGKTLLGSVVFEWLSEGAFLMMHSHIDDERIPDGVAIFGSDDAIGQFFALYFDERGISRKYDVAIERNTLKWWRDTDEFSQRMILAIAGDGQTIVSKGEMNRNDQGWEPDLELTYTRV
jgi:hypothetical protein